MGEMVTAKNVADGAVAEIVQQGYRFQGGLLRPARAARRARSPRSRRFGCPPARAGEQGAAGLRGRSGVAVASYSRSR